MSMKTSVIAAACAVSILSGCASITGTEGQQLALSTTGKDGNPIEGAKCKLSNDRGTWEAKSPAFVDVR